MTFRLQSTLVYSLIFIFSWIAASCENESSSSSSSSQTTTTHAEVSTSTQTQTETQTSIQSPVSQDISQYDGLYNVTFRRQVSSGDLSGGQEFILPITVTLKNGIGQINVATQFGETPVQVQGEFNVDQFGRVTSNDASILIGEQVIPVQILETQVSGSFVNGKYAYDMGGKSITGSITGIRSVNLEGTAENVFNTVNNPGSIEEDSFFNLDELPAVIDGQRLSHLSDHFGVVVSIPVKDNSSRIDHTIRIITFNTNLTEEATFKKQRIEAMISEFEALETPLNTIDVLCLQEVWNSIDMSTLFQRLKTKFPYSYFHDTTDVDSSIFEHNGANGLLMLATHHAEEQDYFDFNLFSTYFNRGGLYAQFQSDSGTRHHVVCSHLSVDNDQEQTYLGKFDTWEDEGVAQALEITRILKDKAGTDPHYIAGTINCSIPNTPRGVHSYQEKICNTFTESAGFSDLTQERIGCSQCQHNYVLIEKRLSGESVIPQNRLPDHIYMKNIPTPNSSIQMERIFSSARKINVENVLLPQEATMVEAVSFFDGSYKSEFVVDGQKVIQTCINIKDGFILQTLDTDLLVEGAVNRQGKLHMLSKAGAVASFIADGNIRENGQIAGTFKIGSNSDGNQGFFTGEKKTPCLVSSSQDETVTNADTETETESSDVNIETETETETTTVSDSGSQQTGSNNSNLKFPGLHVLCSDEIDTTGEDVFEFVVGVAKTLFSGDIIFCRKSRVCSATDTYVAEFPSGDECLAECETLAKEDPQYEPGCEGIRR